MSLRRGLRAIAAAGIAPPVALLLLLQLHGAAPSACLKVAWAGLVVVGFAGAGFDAHGAPAAAASACVDAVGWASARCPIIATTLAAGVWALAGAAELSKRLMADIDEHGGGSWTAHFGRRLLQAAMHRGGHAMVLHVGGLALQLLPGALRLVPWLPPAVAGAAAAAATVGATLLDFGCCVALWLLQLDLLALDMAVQQSPLLRPVSRHAVPSFSAVETMAELLAPLAVSAAALTLAPAYPLLGFLVRGAALGLSIHISAQTTRRVPACVRRRQWTSDGLFYTALGLGTELVAQRLTMAVGFDMSTPIATAAQAAVSAGLAIVLSAAAALRPPESGLASGLSARAQLQALDGEGWMRAGHAHFWLRMPWDAAEVIGGVMRTYPRHVIGALAGYATGALLLAVGFSEVLALPLAAGSVLPLPLLCGAFGVLIAGRWKRRKLPPLWLALKMVRLVEVCVGHWFGDVLLPMALLLPELDPDLGPAAQEMLQMAMSGIKLVRTAAEHHRATVWAAKLAELPGAQTVFGTVPPGLVQWIGGLVKDKGDRRELDATLCATTLPSGPFVGAPR